MVKILINSIASYLDAEELELRAYARQNFVDAENNLTLACEPGGNAFYFVQIRGGALELPVAGGGEYFIGIFDPDGKLKYTLFESVLVPAQETVTLKSLTLL